MADLLLELFSEEIPARMQLRAATDLQKLVTNGLVEAGLTYESAAAFVTPRRLCLTVTGLLTESPTTKTERKGPRVDAPPKAIEGFLRGVGLTQDDLEIRDEKKGQIYYAQIVKQGRPASEIIAEVVPHTIRNFPWPKSMRWGTGTLKWVRPLHSILCILHDEAGAQVVGFDVDGIASSDQTFGHRFHAPKAISVTSFEGYATALKKAYVLLDSAERRDHIWADATNMAFASGMEVVEDAGLLSEVAGLVEWPVVLMGDIAEDFLDLPPEVLQSSMREHQKFFSVKNPKTDRIEKFITVANRETADAGVTILAGNQKVLFARLSDAKFFWQNDLRVPLSDMAAKLSNVTFHNKLGTQAERIQRIARLARELAPIVGADPDLAQQAAEISKADLSSEMVYEFPELQGLMGRYYAQAADLPQEVANACEQHYSPLGPSDDVPSEAVSVSVALADKIDMLTGFWAIDEKPTGSKDPFALRRAALGVIRLILENSLTLPLSIHCVNNLLSFFHDRLKTYLRDQGIPHDVIDACLAMPNNDDLTLLVKRATALTAFIKTDDGTNLLQGYKRANNILSQAESKDGVEYSYGADIKFSQTPEENTLFKALETAESQIAPSLKSQDFAAAMTAMAALRTPIDAFFEAVKINADSDVIRRNRLNLLGQIRKTMGNVADFTKLEG